MIPFLPGIEDLFGWVVDSAASSIFDGIVSWMARGLAVLIEWIWSTLDTATTPRITEPWFATELLGPIGLLALGVVIALMLASAMQAALAGRPEQIVDAFRQGAWSLVATGLSITVMDLLLGIVDAAAAGIWAQARPDLQGLLEGVITVITAGSVSGMGFLAVLMLLFMYLALIGLAVALAMRNALIYVTAALAPLVFASSVLPMFRDSARKIVHLATSLIVSKLAIVITLTLAVKMMANATEITSSGDQLQDGVGALGVLFAGVVCFAVASITPVVLYKLMPTVESAVVGAGVASGWGRGAMSGLYAASTARNLASSVTKLASGPTPTAGTTSSGGSQDPASGAPTATPPPGGGGPGGGAGGGSVTSGAGGSSATAAGASSSGGAAAGGTAGAAAGAGAAGAGALPVAAVAAAAKTVTDGTKRLGAEADAAVSAAAARHPAGHTRPEPSQTAKPAPSTERSASSKPVSRDV